MTNETDCRAAFARRQKESCNDESCPTDRRLILLVEDDPAVQEYYSQVLTAAHCPFDLAPNGELGWEILQSNDYSLIVTDHDMPRLTGLGLLQRLDDNGYRLPVILISGTIPMNDGRLVGLCLFATLSKPVAPTVLLDLITQALSLDLPLWFTHPIQHARARQRPRERIVIEERSSVWV